MNSDVSITIPAGNAVALTVAWTDMAGVAQAPVSVRYQVFDERTRASTSAIINVPTPTATMTFTVAAASLPGSTTTGLRKLIIQIEGSFSNGDLHKEHVAVSVQRAFTFA